MVILISCIHYCILRCACIIYFLCSEGKNCRDKEKTKNQYETKDSIGSRWEKYRQKPSAWSASAALAKLHDRCYAWLEYTENPNANLCYDHVCITFGISWPHDGKRTLPHSKFSDHRIVAAQRISTVPRIIVAGSTITTVACRAQAGSIQVPESTYQ